MEDKVQINGILMVYKALCQHPVLKRGEKEKKREGKERKEGEEEQEEQEEKKIKERNEIQPETLLFQGFQSDCFLQQLLCKVPDFSLVTSARQASVQRLTDNRSLWL